VAAEFVPLFYLHRARYVESAGAAATLPACTTLPGAAELREVVAAHAVALLPEVQRRLVLQEPTTTPSAGVAAPLQVVKSGALNSEGVGGDWRLEVRPWGLHPPPLYTTLGSGTAPTTPPQMHTTAATMAANAANAPPPAQPTPIPSTPARTPATAATGRYRAPPPSMDAQLAGLPPTPLSAADGEGSDVRSPRIRRLPPVCVSLLDAESTPHGADHPLVEAWQRVGGCAGRRRCVEFVAEGQCSGKYTVR
jgi:hypothetical protein